MTTIPHAALDSANCADCGKPIHRTPGPSPCCDQDGWHHDSAADMVACPGTSTHVQPETIRQAWQRAMRDNPNPAADGLPVLRDTAVIPDDAQ